ncbi:MAG: phosphoglycerate dehydrogenase [Deltaproteobacteria bacterium]|nr:phosphoglycerate dehydrogenase [Deltaproteobacteria bacterium]
MGKRALILCLHLQRHLERYAEVFQRYGIEVEAPPVEQQMREAELLPIIGSFDGVIAGDDEFTHRVLEAGRPRLQIVSKWGIGVDGIDREAAHRLGIQVTNTPDAFADEVADVVLGYLVLLTRRLHLMDRSVREGGWSKPQGTSLRGKRLGVVGVGSIGRAVVRRGQALGMEVSGTDIGEIETDFRRETGLVQKPLEDLLGSSDFVSLNCPLTPQTRHLIDGAALARMPAGSYLINTGRGQLVDEAALVEALASGHLAGAALDVFEREPLAASSPLLGFDGVVLGTHNASNTLEAVLRVNELSIENLLRGLGMEL